MATDGISFLAMHTCSALNIISSRSGTILEIQMKTEAFNFCRKRKFLPEFTRSSQIRSDVVQHGSSSLVRSSVNALLLYHEPKLAEVAVKCVLE